MQAAHPPTAAPSAPPPPTLTVETAPPRAPLVSRAFLGWLLVFYSVWGVVVVVWDCWPSIVANWPIAVAMSFGSYIAGSTPMGGGTVGFPVLVLLFHHPASLGRDFSLASQSIGMTSASIYLITTRRRIAWRMLAWAIAAGALSTVLNLLFVAHHVQDTAVKLAFASLWASFGLMMLFKIRAVAKTEGIQAQSPQHDALIGIAVGLIGGFIVSITGVGIDMLIFVALTVFARASLQISIPTAVVLMASMSLVGAATKTVTHTWDYSALQACLAAAPIVVLGAPLGAFFVRIIDRRYTLLVVSVLCLAQYAWTCFLKQLSWSAIGMSLGAILSFNLAVHFVHERRSSLLGKTT